MKTNWKTILAEVLRILLALLSGVTAKSLTPGPSPRRGETRGERKQPKIPLSSERG